MAVFSNVRVLVGFQGLLQRTVVQFIESVPTQKLCSLCGTVPKRLNIANCSHPFCDICLGLIAQRSYVCPLDDFVLKPADTVQKETEEQDIGEVFCPNKVHGCEFTGTPTDTLARHLPECNFHQVQCRRCLAMTKHSLILDHVAYCQRLCHDNKNDASVMNFVTPQSKSQQTTECQSFSTEHLPDFVRSAESYDPAMIRLLKIQEAISSLQSLVQDRMPSTTLFGSAVQAALSKTSEERVCTAKDPRVEETIAGFKGFMKREMDKTLSDYMTTGQVTASPENTDALLAKLDLLDRKLSMIQTKTCKTKGFWHVEGYDSLKNEVDPELQLASRFSEPLIIAGYTVKLQVDIDKSEPPTSWLGMYAIFMKGPADEFLDWPVKKPILFTLVHPETGKKNVKKHLIPSARKDLVICFSRPDGQGANEGCGYDRMIPIETMEREGFILNDAFTVALSIRQNMPMRFID